MVDADVLAKKGTGLGDLFKEYNPQQLEENLIQYSAENNHFRDILEKYQTLIRSPFFNGTQAYLGSLRSYVRREVYDVFTPQELNLILQLTLPYDRQEYQYAPITSCFMTQLIKNSYNGGHNNFTLNTKPIHQELIFFGENLHGCKYNPLKVAVDGNLLFVPGQDSTHCQFHVRGDIEHLPYDWTAENYTLTLEGKINDLRGALTLVNNKNVTFKITDETTVKGLLEEQSSGTRICHLVDGKEIIRRDYDTPN